MEQATSLSYVFTSTSAIRYLTTSAVGRRQARLTNVGKQKPFLHVGDSILWCPERKLRRLISPLYSTIKSAQRVFASSNGFYCAFVFTTYLLLCDLRLAEGTPNLASINIPLTKLHDSEILKLFISDDGLELAFLTSLNSLYAFSVHADHWESIPLPLQRGKFGVHIHWTPEKMSMYYVTATDKDKQEIFISILSRSRGTSENITTIWNWKTSNSFGFFLMESVDLLAEGNLDISLDYHYDSNTLSVIASRINSCVLAMIHLSSNPGGYLLPILQIMHRKTHIRTASTDSYNHDIESMTWLFSTSMPILVLMSQTGKLICVTPGGSIWFPTDMPMINPLERINKVLPILDPAFSVSTDAKKGSYCITSGVDLDNRIWLLATDGHILSSCVIEPKFELFNLPKQSIFTPCEASKWHDYVTFGLSTETISETLLGSFPESLNVLLDWIDVIFLPCQTTKLMLGLEFVQSMLYRLFCFTPSRDFLAIHIIRHTEKWLSLIFGEKYIWKNGWQPIIANLSQRSENLTTAEEALYETALLLGPTTPDSLEPFQDIEAICQYIQGGDVIKLFQSKFSQFLVSLHQNLQFAYDLVMSTILLDDFTTEISNSIRITWIDFCTQLIYSKEYQWTIPVYVPSVLDNVQKIEVDTFFLQKSFSTSPSIFAPETLFEIAARNEEHALNLLASSKSWFFCWTTRLLFALTLEHPTETPAIIDDILSKMINENNVKELLFVGRVIQTFSIALPTCYTELLIDKLKEQIRSNFTLVPPDDKRDYPSIHFLITQSILESNFSESSNYIMILDWIRCCLYFSHHQEIFYNVTRVLYSLDLRTCLIENDSQSVTYLESSLALAHFDDLFSSSDIIELVKLTLQRYPQSQWLDILQATTFTLSPTVISGILTFLKYENINVTFSSELLEDPRFIAFHQELSKTVEENLYVTTTNVSSLYDAMQIHWLPELPPLLSKDAWLSLLQSIEAHSLPPSQTNENNPISPLNTSPAFEAVISSPISLDKKQPSLDCDNKEFELELKDETKDETKDEAKNKTKEQSERKTDESFQKEEVCENNSFPLKGEAIPKNLLTNNQETLEKESLCFEVSSSVSQECIRLLSSLKLNLEELQTDVKNLILPDIKSKRKTHHRPQTTSSVKKKNIIRTLTRPTVVHRSPSFEKFLSDRAWKKKEAELMGLKSPRLRNLNSHFGSKEVVKLTLLHDKA